MRTVVIIAFEDREIRTALVKLERLRTIRTREFGMLMKFKRKRKERITNFAF